MFDDYSDVTRARGTKNLGKSSVTQKWDMDQTRVSHEFKTFNDGSEPHMLKTFKLSNPSKVVRETPVSPGAGLASRSRHEGQYFGMPGNNVF